MADSMTKGYFLQSRSGVLGFILVTVFVGLSLFGPLLAPYDPNKQHLDKCFVPPQHKFLLGTDQLGRDLLSRLLYGTRISLMIAASAVAFGLTVGMTLGLITGYFGGWVDDLIMRIVDILLAFPGMMFALALSAAMGPGFVNVVLAIGIASSPLYARVVRGTILRLKGRVFVLAAKASGAGTMRILLHHLLPNCLGPIIIQTTLRFANSIIVAAGLSFLGLGVPPNVPELGSMLADGRVYLRSASWVALSPGLSLMFMVLGFNLMGDGLRDVLDPRSRLSRR